MENGHRGPGKDKPILPAPMVVRLYEMLLLVPVVEALCNLMLGVDVRKGSGPEETASPRSTANLDRRLTRPLHTLVTPACCFCVW